MVFILSNRSIGTKIVIGVAFYIMFNIMIKLDDYYRLQNRNVDVKIRRMKGDFYGYFEE